MEATPVGIRFTRCAHNSCNMNARQNLPAESRGSYRRATEIAGVMPRGDGRHSSSGANLREFSRRSFPGLTRGAHTESTDCRSGGIMNVRSIRARPLLWIVGAGAGAVLLVAIASAMAGSLAIAEQPGRSIGVPAVSVQPTGASTAAATPAPMPSAEPTIPSSSPEVVPAQDPVVVDDHGGGDPGHDDDSGPDDSGGSSDSGSSGSGSSDG